MKTMGPATQATSAIIRRRSPFAHLSCIGTNVNKARVISTQTTAPTTATTPAGIGATTWSGPLGSAGAEALVHFTTISTAQLESVSRASL